MLCDLDRALNIVQLDSLDLTLLPDEGRGIFIF